MITKNKDGFSFEPFPVITDKTKHFLIEENVVYFSEIDEIFCSERDKLS